MKKLILERVTERDSNNYASWVTTIQDDNDMYCRSNIVMGDINRIVDIYFGEKYDVTVYDDDANVV